MILSFRLNRPVTQQDVEPYLWSLKRAGRTERAGKGIHQGDGLAELLGDPSCAMVNDKFQPAADADRSEPPVTLAELTPPEEKPWRLWSKIARHLFFHVTIERNWPTRDLVAAALDS